MLGGALILALVAATCHGWATLPASGGAELTVSLGTNGAQVYVAADIISTDPSNVNCSLQGQDAEDFEQFGVAYAKSFSLVVQGKRLAVMYRGGSIKCCVVPKSVVDEDSMTPCGAWPVEQTTRVPTSVEPTTPEPTTPEMITHDPTTPEPTTPEPTTPEPTTPETPQPTTPEPTTPAPTTPEPTTPEPTTERTTLAPYYTCPSSFKKNGNYCFYFSKAEKEWSEANAACKKLHSSATLARPHTKAINDYIISNIKKTDEHHWFDLNDKKSEGKFKFSNSQSLSYKNWASGEPNNGPWFDPRDEDCVVFDSDEGFKWNDENCGNDYRYVCQMDAILNTPV